MALDIKPTRSELIKLKGRIKQTKNGYKLLKMKRDGLFHEFRKLLSEMIEAKRDLTDTYRLAKQRIDLANAIEGGLAVRAAAIANTATPQVEDANLDALVIHKSNAQRHFANQLKHRSDTEGVHLWVQLRWRTLDTEAPVRTLADISIFKCYLHRVACISVEPVPDFFPARHLS